MENLERHAYPGTEKIQQMATRCYHSLDARLFDNYIEEKANPIIGALEQNMYAGKFDWARCPKPKTVRNYVKEAIMAIIEVSIYFYWLYIVTFCVS